MTRALLTLMITAILAGCSSLPRDGPTGRATAPGALGDAAFGGYALVDMTYEVSERLKATPVSFLGSLSGADSQAPVDVIGVGDALAVSIFEPSGTLFGSGVLGAQVRGGSQALPTLVVDRNGAVGVPFAGQVRVAGLTSGQAADAIRRALTGRAANPQVIVSVTGNASNTVTVLGEVREPGRADLGANADRILDVIAAAGGTPRPPEDIEVTIQREGRVYAAPLTAVSSIFGENVRLSRGDQINLTYKPRRYSTFGALGRVSEVDMGSGSVSLAAALSRVGGLDTNSANVRQILVFRFERPEAAQALGLTQPATSRGVPVVYRLDLSQTGGFFVANSFAVQNEDILYVPRADSAELRKFFEFVQTITRVVYDVSVTSTLTTD